MYFLDTDFLYSLFFAGQSTSDQAKDLADKIYDQDLRINNYVLFELLTVLSKREGQVEAIATYKKLLQVPNIKIYKLSRDEDAGVLNLFTTYTKKNISMVDCSNLYLAQKLPARIISFDKFYPREVKNLIELA